MVYANRTGTRRVPCGSVPVRLAIRFGAELEDHERNKYGSYDKSTRSPHPETSKPTKTRRVGGVMQEAARFAVVARTGAPLPVGKAP